MREQRMPKIRISLIALHTHTPVAHLLVADSGNQVRRLLIHSVLMAMDYQILASCTLGN
jgi:hypothetical protein